MNLWSEYVQRLYADSGSGSEDEFVQGMSINQSTLGRWRRGVKTPDRAVVVAEFARDLGRNPVEAFVAADMLTIEEAGRALSAGERAFLVGLIDKLGAQSAAAWDGDDAAPEPESDGDDNKAEVAS